MDDDIARDLPIPAEDSSSDIPEEWSNNIDSLEAISSRGNMVQELENAGEILTRVEIDLACFSEKLFNLNVLVMHVETRENDFEAFVSDLGHELSYKVEKALQFDFLSGVLDSELRELDDSTFVSQTEIARAREILSSCEHLGDTYKAREGYLHESEETLRQLREQVSDLRVQSANFQNILSSFNEEENGNDHQKVEFLESGTLLNMHPKINMQTAEQQRDILRMLEKSLARELELENKVAELRQEEEDLKLRLQQVVFWMDEEASVTWQRVFEAENSSELLMGISKELLGRLQIFQFNIKGLNQREHEFISKLQDSCSMLKSNEAALQNLERTNSELKAKVSFLEKQLEDSESELENGKASRNRAEVLHSKVVEMENIMREKLSDANVKTENTEAQCKSLTEISNSKENKVDSLERQLREAEIKLQHAAASADASQEKQNMLHSMIKDMENLIEILKSRVSKAERLTESAEDKCIILSEANAELNEELNFARERMESMEASLLLAEETKKATAKDISIRTKFITDLVMQLALERERLHNQLCSLMRDKKDLVAHLQQSKNQAVTMSNDGKGNSKEVLVCSHDFVTTATTKGTAVAVGLMDQQSQLSSTDETKVGLAGSEPEIDAVRNIDARQLNFKYVAIPILILVISVFAGLWSQQQDLQV